MASDVKIWEETYQSYGDMRSNQFYFVEYQADGVVQKCSAQVAVTCGILQDQPNSGQSCVVMHLGRSKMVCTSNLAVGNLINPAATGAGEYCNVGTDTTHYVAAMAKITMSSGDIGECLLRGTPVRAA